MADEPQFPENKIYDDFGAPIGDREKRLTDLFDGTPIPNVTGTKKEEPTATATATETRTTRREDDGTRFMSPASTFEHMGHD